ncbi:hypothetical protein BN1088_1433372 [Sphingobacterium sp. PM2-P1-29]|nr:hypothetical protein BN1088_1433372 [Sphingobacterium sp. PM2-P1-29]
MMQSLYSSQIKKDHIDESNHYKKIYRFSKAPFYLFHVATSTGLSHSS